MQRPLPALADVDRDGLRVVPPEFDRHAAEEREGFDRPVQDRLGAFRGKRDGERRVRVTPRDEEHGHETTAVREIDMDVAEVGFGPHARTMLQRDERLATVEPEPTQIAPDLVVLAGVALLRDQTSVNLSRRVTLLPWSRLVRGQNRIDELAERAEHRCRPRRR